VNGLHDRGLLAALNRVACVPHLLVACDYDGTLAPIVDDPAAAIPLPEAISAIRDLASLPSTTVAVISSRALRDLATLSRLPGEVHLVGSHGTEHDVAFVQRLPDDLVALRTRLWNALAELTRELSGVRLEAKPAGVAVHTRMADDQTAERAAKAVMAGPGSWPEIFVTNGKKVIDLSVLVPQKGAAVATLRSRTSASAVLFLGDDISDEDVFHRLREPDAGIKVGEGHTLAQHRVADPHETALVLRAIVDTRRRWLFGEPSVPIERHSMLANGHTVALVTPDARVTWFCHPRPDSPPLFADLLGGRGAGHFSVAPERGGRPQSQRYRGASMTVETRWSDLVVTDWLDVATGRTSLVRWLTGTGTARIEFAPRPDFGQIPVQLEATGDGLLIVGGSEPTALWSRGVTWEVVEGAAHATVDLSVTGPIGLDLRCGWADLTAPSSHLEDRLEAAERPWREWAASLTLPQTAREAVLRSALTLRGLCHEPTGAILAAATTSLPELVGGMRNWDYRYCWLRDAAMTARALVGLGSLAEAEALLRWIDRCVGRTGGHPEQLRPLYTIDGLDLGAEAVIETLPGYKGSRPVRVGNAANGQLQLDVFGPVADLIAAVVAARGRVLDHEWQLIEAMAEAVGQRWHEPDHGLWEARLTPRHHVHSKVMCWWTMERSLEVANLLRRPPAQIDAWEGLRDDIRDDVLENGWNEELQAFTEAYQGTEVDAATLWIGLAGLVPVDDDRFHSTLRAIEKSLRSGPTVYRYKWDDGMPGREGGFHICTTWMIEAYLHTGRRIEAESLFAQYLACLGPTGLMPEMYDPVEERGLGNHPQAYSHLGLIRCAQLLDEA